MIRLLPLLVLAACASPARPLAPAPIPVEVSYETGPCFGRCPVYRVTVNNLGKPGVFEGKRFTAVEGTREFAVDPAGFDAFYAALAEARAADPAAFARGGPRCRMAATDHPSVSVTFHEGQREPWAFRFDYGCHDPENARLAADLRRAPDMLPIADFIGRR